MLLGLPDIGTMGQFAIEIPFKNKIPEESVLVCVAVRLFKELITANIDIVETYYKPYGLDEVKYKVDAATPYPAIVTLQDQSGKLFYIVSTYITAFPKTGGVPYAGMGLFLSLGALPTNFSLEPLQLKLEQVVKDYLGIVKVTQRTAQLTRVGYVTSQTHDSLEATRKSNIKDNELDYAKNVRLQSDYDKLAAEHEALKLAYLNKP